MKQILQSLGTGETLLADVPAPGVRPGCLLICTRASLVSIGTERMLVDFGKAGWIEKARKQPDKVRQVLAKIKTDGLWPTVDAVRSKLAMPIPLGYCNAGVVLAVGAGVEGWSVGDRVLSNGSHAEVVVIGVNLCARIPDEVSDAHAAFGVVGAIALHGIRLLQPTLGETFVVTGLGLIGLLATQLLRAHGCEVIGVDFSPAKCALARAFGAETVDLSRGEDPLVAARSLTRGRGVDGVLITASTQSSDPANQGARMCRKRGRIVQVGATGMELQRSEFYEKELTFQVSCSYGPGRYDPNYEEKGQDYPIGHARWTEQRNFEAVLGQMAAGRLKVDSLLSHRFGFDNALEAYQTVSDAKALGILLEYTGDPAAFTTAVARRVNHVAPVQATAQAPVLGFLGAGNFTTRVLLPALKDCGVVTRRKAIVSGAGVSGALAARNFGFEVSSTDSATVINDPEINTVFITTRHNAHARQVVAALTAGKHVFVEKPLCLDLEELPGLEQAVAAARGLLMVGYNRRFSPHVERMKSLLDGVRAPRAMIFTANAGAIPANHWTQDPVVGGGRIVGEACHYVDLLRFLAGAPIIAGSADFLGDEDGRLGDVASLHLRFANGSVGTVHYFANGENTFPKERLEVFCAGRVLQLDNFRVLTGHGWKGFSKFKTARQDKGHAQEVTAFLTAIRDGKPSPIPVAELLEVSRVVLELVGSRAGTGVVAE